KPEAEPPSVGDEQAPKAAFFANAAAPTATSGSTTGPSFFNPGGVTNPFFGGSGSNAFQADSDLERDSEQEFETNDDSDGQGERRDDSNDETEARASN
ncbi:MAG TPA: hypothetical protein QF409_12555, partial [Acidimicrobiales bacterium]|nr:hypothetical protein [Acidimicrobiales bacterium]